ncbi:MAG: MBL fold metallo-hydrolase [Pseudomonadota bacterium]
MKVTVLGCGGSGGVPLADGTPGGHWGDCDPSEPRNRRRRVSVLVEGDRSRGQGALIIDCSPDLREQLLDHPPERMDAVLLTHAHADHVHGIDDLRAFTYRQREAIPTFMDATTHAAMIRRFDYVFKSSHAESHLYPALLDDRVITAGETFEAAGFKVLPFAQEHGQGTTLGFRIGSFAYSTDASALDEAAFEALAGVDLWIVDCLRDAPHPTHSHYDKTLGWIARVQPKKALLTHMNHSVDYRVWAERCPAGVEPAYDGQVLQLDLPPTG